MRAPSIGDSIISKKRQLARSLLYVSDDFDQMGRRETSIISIIVGRERIPSGLFRYRGPLNITRQTQLSPRSVASGIS